jgi:hypothetical protein
MIARIIVERRRKMKAKPWFFVTFLFAAALFAAGCGGESGPAGDADVVDGTDARDGAEAAEHVDGPGDVPTDNPVDNPVDQPGDTPTDEPADTSMDDAQVDTEGCTGNDECPADEFCEFLAGLCGGVGMCASRGAGMCPDIYAPVCGCDGVTYGNDCERRYAGVSLDYPGECVAEECTQGDPGDVCGDGAFCEGRAGVCNDTTPGWCEPTPLGCPDVYLPFCGCDGHTYGNDCERKVAGVWLAYEGECATTVCYQGDPSGVCASTDFCEGPAGVCSDTTPGWCVPIPDLCPDVYAPVCGCDGNTYSNDCERQRARAWLAYRGECASEVCTQGDPDGVCGHDEFCDGPAGACSFLDVPGWCTPVPGVCPGIWDPVCGCDGNTYGNDCMRQAAQVWLNYRGECGSAIRRCNPDTPCPRLMFCEYPTGDCGMTSASEGRCLNMPTICTPLWAPVCGCDGHTYGNDCERMAAGVSKRADGACP